MIKAAVPIPELGQFACVVEPNTLDSNGILIPHQWLVLCPVHQDTGQPVLDAWVCPGAEGYQTGAPIQDLYRAAVDVAVRVVTIPTGTDEKELHDAMVFAGNYFPEGFRVPTVLFTGVTLLRVVASALQAMVQFRVSNQGITDPVFLQTQEQALQRLASAVDFQACKGSW